MNILLVSPHADDAEISCGGAIARLRTPQNVIWSIYFAPCHEDPKNINHLEQHRKATRLLGIDKLIEHCFLRDILESYKQEIRNILWNINQTFHPELVFCPSLHDLHQDHQTVAECCLTIFRNSIILGYESIASCPSFSPNLFMELSKSDVEQKIRAVECYESQIKARSSYFRPDVLMAQSVVHGAQIRTEWAEAYEFIWGGFLNGHKGS